MNVCFTRKRGNLIEYVLRFRVVVLSPKNAMFYKPKAPFTPQETHEKENRSIALDIAWLLIGLILGRKSIVWMKTNKENIVVQLFHSNKYFSINKRGAYCLKNFVLLLFIFQCISKMAKRIHFHNLMEQIQQSSSI